MASTLTNCLVPASVSTEYANNPSSFDVADAALKLRPEESVSVLKKFTRVNPLPTTTSSPDATLSICHGTPKVPV